MKSLYIAEAPRIVKLTGDGQVRLSAKFHDKFFQEK
jgi:hypothetical protein